MKKWIKEEDVMGVLGIAPPELLVDHIADLDGTYMDDEDVVEVALDHLKAAADKLGYDLVPKKKGGELLPCPRCGCEEIRLGYILATPNNNSIKRCYYYECSECRSRVKRAVCNRTDIARKRWKEMVEGYENC